MKKIAVILSGCGVNDGTEIHEAVSMMVALDKNNVKMIYAAPAAPQMHVIDHVKGEPVQNESRNILTESARISRGEIEDIKNIDPDEIDGIAFPGGFGAAKNLCDFAVAGKDMKVNPDVERLILKMVEQKKAVLAVCIAPALVAKVLGERKVRFTIGNDAGTAEALASFGGTHVDTDVKTCVVDEDLKVVTAPAYMLASGPAEVYENIRIATEKFVELI